MSLGLVLLAAGLVVHITLLIVAGAAMGLLGFMSLVGDATSGSGEDDLQRTRRR
jgi:hypothetical protein